MVGATKVVDQIPAQERDVVRSGISILGVLEIMPHWGKDETEVGGQQEKKREASA